MFNCLIFNHYLAQRIPVRQRPFAMAEDPWGNHRPSDEGKEGNQKPVDQPPDLEELFAKLFRRVGKGGGHHNGGSQPTFNIQFNGKFALVTGAVILGMWLSLGVYTVKERENGVETFLGKYSETSKSGLNWHVPFPLGKVEVVDVESISTMRVGEFKTQKATVSTKNQRVGQMLTKDENIVEIGAAVQYRIADAKAFQFHAADPVDVLSDVVTSAIREVVGANTVDDILTDRRNEWPQQARRIIVDTLKDYDLGIEVIAFELQDARVPAEVQDAFEDAVRAREDEERLRLQAEAFANERLPIARGYAEQLLQGARAYSVTNIARAEAEATRFDELLLAYRKNKDALRRRMYLDTMNAVYANNRKLVLEGDSKPIINFAPISQAKVETAVVAQPESKSTPTVVSSSSSVKSTPEPVAENSSNRSRSRHR